MVMVMYACGHWCEVQPDFPHGWLPVLGVPAWSGAQHRQPLMKGRGESDAAGVQWWDRRKWCR